MSNDPWAAAQQQTPGRTDGSRGASQGASQAVADREAEFRAMGGDNPFGTDGTVGGGSGVRGPAWPDLLDRLVVLKPLEKKLGQPVPGQPNNTQDFYSCELTVLDGGKLTVVTPAKPAQGDKPALEEVRNEYDVPFTFSDWYAYGKGVTAKLDALKLPMFLGVVKRCPIGPEYRRGLTWEDKAKEWEAYRQALIAGREVAKPQYSWNLIDPTPEQQKLAMDWWKTRTATA